MTEFIVVQGLGRKALDNINLKQMSHRYVSGALQNDWNDPVDFRSLDRSQRRCYIWVSLSYKTVNTVEFQFVSQKNVKSVIDSAVLHWTTRLMVFARKAGLGRCYLVSTRQEIPGIVNRTFQNRTQSNSIRGLSSIEFGNRTKSNTTLSVSSISEQIEFNRTNRTQSNSIRLIVFDWVRKPNGGQKSKPQKNPLGFKKKKPKEITGQNLSALKNTLNNIDRDQRSLGRP